MRNKVLVTLMLSAGLTAASAWAQGIVVWDNGSAEHLHGWRPSAGWDPIGMIEDFDVPSHGYSAFNYARIEMIDGTRGLGQPSIIDATRLRIFSAPDGLAGVDADNDAPVYDHTYTEADGDMLEIDSGRDLYSRDVLYFDLFGPIVDLAPGHYGFMINFPGMGPIDSFWAVPTDPRDGEGTEDGGIIGGGIRYHSVDEPLAFRLEIPEPATLTLLGLGSLALLRRR